MGSASQEEPVPEDVPVCFTVGHSNHQPGHLVALLSIHRVAVVLDVRSFPYSRYAHQFNRETVENMLSAAGFRYRWCGDRLGGRPRASGTHGRPATPEYDLARSSPSFREGIEAIAASARRGTRCGLMCAEKDPADCHRAVLIAPALDTSGVRVYHILADGSLLAHEALKRGSRDRQQKLDSG
jgi:uncharacterized protein (DUF488 family)